MYVDRVFRITFFTRIGATSWRPYEKKFCDDEKELKKLIHKCKLTTDRRNRSPRRECYFVVEEFVENAWQQVHEYPEKEQETDKEEN